MNRMDRRAFLKSAGKTAALTAGALVLPWEAGLMSSASAAPFKPSFIAYDIEPPLFTSSQQAAIDRAHDFDYIVCQPPEGNDLGYSQYTTAMFNEKSTLHLGSYINLFHHPDGPGQNGGVNSDWYVHWNNQNQTLATAPTTGDYIMNPNKNGWVAFQADEIDSRLASSHYNEIFVDGGGLGPWEPGMLNPNTNNTWTKHDWLYDCRASWNTLRDDPDLGVPRMANNIGSPSDFYDTNSGSQLMLSGTANGPWFSQVFTETYLRGATDAVSAPPTGYPSATQYDEWKGMLNDCNGRLGCLTKLWDATSTQTNRDKWHAYALAAYMCTGKPGTAFYCTGVTTGAKATTRVPMHSWWSFAKSLQTANASEVSMNGGNVRRRDFDNGKVYINLTGGPETVAIGSGWQDQTLTNRSGNLTLTAKQGILLRPV